MSKQFVLFPDESALSGFAVNDSEKENIHISQKKENLSLKNEAALRSEKCTSVSGDRTVSQRSFTGKSKNHTQQKSTAKSCPSTHEKGLDGENRAAKFLSDKGYEIVDRNYHIRGGEIDIIAIDRAKETLVFVEVKSLPHGNIETLAHELGFRKQQNVIKTAKYYLQNHRQYNYMYIRFDVLALDVPGLEPVRHLVNAFSE